MILIAAFCSIRIPSFGQRRNHAYVATHVAQDNPIATRFGRYVSFSTAAGTSFLVSVDLGRAVSTRDTVAVEIPASRETSDILTTEAPSAAWRRGRAVLVSRHRVRVGALRLDGAGALLRA
jgi:hypothetical protein